MHRGTFISFLFALGLINPTPPHATAGITCGG